MRIPADTCISRHTPLNMSAVQKTVESTTCWIDAGKNADVCRCTSMISERKQRTETCKEKMRQRLCHDISEIIVSGDKADGDAARLNQLAHKELINI